VHALNTLGQRDSCTSSSA